MLTPAPPPLLLTRPAAASRRFASAWRKSAGGSARVVIAPVTAITMRGIPAGLADGRVLVFTSENGVAAAGDAHPGARAWCVGARTAARAAAAGFSVRSAAGDADALVAAILASGDPGPFLHVRGAAARGEVAARLAAAGRDCSAVVAYAQEAMPLSEEATALLAAGGPVLLPLFSPGSAHRLGGALQAVPVRARLLVAAMSDAVAAAWIHPASARVAVAARPDAAAMVAALAGLAAGKAP